MSAFSGDFLGFTLGNWHSTQLNITRVSTSDRYSEQITPQFNNVATQIPGGDGMYYWNTYFTQKQINIDFAFDDMREEDIRRLKMECNKKGIKDLIFDEEPWKTYRVIVASPPILKYIAFSGDRVTIYKGEGSISLVSYLPYAFGPKKIINLRTVQITIDDNEENPAYILLNNIGDMPIPLNFMIKSTTQFYGSETSVPPRPHTEVKLEIREGIELNSTLLSSLTLKSNLHPQMLEKDKWNISYEYPNDNPPSFQVCYYSIDSVHHLIEEYKSNSKNKLAEKTGRIFNKNIISGDFLIIPPGVSYLHMNPAQTIAEINLTPQYY